MDGKNTYQQPVTDYIRKDFSALSKNITVDDALIKLEKKA
jgi:hypothetical protein